MLLNLEPCNLSWSCPLHLFTSERSIRLMCPTFISLRAHANTFMLCLCLCIYDSIHSFMFVFGTEKTDTVTSCLVTFSANDQKNVSVIENWLILYSHYWNSSCTCDMQPTAATTRLETATLTKNTEQENDTAANTNEKMEGAAAAHTGSVCWTEQHTEVTRKLWKWGGSSRSECDDCVTCALFCSSQVKWKFQSLTVI